MDHQADSGAGSPPAPPGDVRLLSVVSQVARELAADLPPGLSRLSVSVTGIEIGMEWSRPAEADVVPVPRSEPMATGPDAGAADAGADRRVVVTAPLVGTFYAAESPDAEPFVEVGCSVDAGQPVGIVEAMKLLNPVLAPVTGIVREVLVANGDSVEFDQPLMRVEAS